jgi:hypothetical protein
LIYARPQPTETHPFIKRNAVVVQLIYSRRTLTLGSVGDASVRVQLRQYVGTATSFLYDHPSSGYSSARVVDTPSEAIAQYYSYLIVAGCVMKSMRKRQADD